MAKALKKNDRYRFVTGDIQPSHTTFNTLRRRLGPQGVIEIHTRLVGKAHSLRTLSGVLLVTLLASANESDQAFVVPLAEELVSRCPSLTFPFLILDRGYDTEEIHHDIYEVFGIIPLIRKKMVYLKGCTNNGYPLCPWGFPMKPRGFEYHQGRTNYACFTLCTRSGQPFLFHCENIKEHYKCGYTCRTYFEHGYSTYGPAVPPA